MHERTGRLVGGTRQGHVLRFDGIPPEYVSCPVAPPMVLMPAGDAMVPVYASDTFGTEVYRRTQTRGSDGHVLYVLHERR